MENHNKPFYKKFTLNGVLETEAAYNPEKVWSKIEDLLGDTIIDISYDGETLTIKAINALYNFSHSKECLETVYLNDITGYLEDLIGSPILVAECREVAYDEASAEYGKCTFFHLATVKGRVDFRFIGESNGFYSVDVDVRKFPSNNIN
jgi:hypothetical protein